jgi:High potential iron-sulfur protein
MAESHAYPRRRFIKLTATAFVVAPFANALLCENAAAADLIKESDPAAVKLKYKEDAAKAPERTSPIEFCDNCLLYQSKDSAYGTCSALDNKLVAAKGWCISWSG